MSRDKEATDSRPSYATNTAVPPHMPPPYFGSYAAAAFPIGPPPPHPPSAPHMDDKGQRGGYHPYTAVQTGAAPSHMRSNGHHVYPAPGTNSAATANKKADNAPHHAQGIAPSQNTNKAPYPALQPQGGPEPPMGYPVHADSWRSHPPPFGQHAAASMPPGMMGPPRDPPHHPGYSPWHHHHPHPPPPSYGAPPPPNFWANAPPPPPPPPPSTSASHVQNRAEPPPQPQQPQPQQSSSAPPAATKPYEQAQYSAADYDDRVARASSPSQIENHHREEVKHMGCTCKKTRCLKLYCQCFGVKLYCGHNCRCLNCYNTHANEKKRREAIHMILLRNPGAFDTKFKKAMGAAESAPTVPVEDDSTASRVLTHKLGCKCRKSACMKKYCECYAGNVKCSSNCRCMGCKNMGTGTPNSFDNEPNNSFALHPNPSGSHHSSYPSHPTTILPAPQQHGVTSSSAGSHVATGEPWVAAQNLTFMKHGSPDKKKQSKAHEGDMPSLASSSEGTSPGEAVRLRDKEDEEGAKALLMAAVAMTEFGQSSPQKSTGENHRKRPFATEAASRISSAKMSKASSGPAKQKLPW